MRTTIALGALLAAGLAGCAGMGQDRYAGPVIVTEPGAVARCASLGTLEGNSGLFGFLALKGADNIRQDLLRQADARGATHVVWEKPDVGYSGTSVTGRAYRCPPPPPEK